jgi:16S rRNA (guanine527-N7)-methyltransferase
MVVDPGMSELRDHIREFSPSFGLDLKDDVLARLVGHYELLVKWNAKINLTRIVDPSEASRFHYLESLWVSERLDSPARLVDVGSGAGFPGVPLAIVRPETPVMLLEPNAKKATFLRECVRSLQLRNVRVVAERFHVERVTRDDVIVSRAVERLETILPSLLASSARAISVLTFRELLSATPVSDRTLEIDPVPLATNRVLGRFGARGT